MNIRKYLPSKLVFAHVLHSGVSPAFCLVALELGTPLLFLAALGSTMLGHMLRRHHKRHHKRKRS